MDWWEERDRERSEEYARGKVICDRLREKYDKEICERIDKRRAGLLPPLVLDRIENGKEVWVEDSSWKPAARGRVRGGKVHRRKG